jgi:hypothetical protein
MGLDLYVMPLWRFKAGDFRTPSEVALKIRPKLASPDGIAPGPAPPGMFARWRARREVATIRRAVERANHTRVRWNDDGDVVYSSWSRGMEALRAYAMWLDCRRQLPEFGPAPGGDYYRHPALSLGVEPRSCPHVVEHDCFNGYYLPSEFPRITHVEPYKMLGEWPTAQSVGSSVRLREELNLVQERLQVPEGYDFPQDDPLIAVKAAYLQMRKIAELSCRHGLPIIFWG